MVAEQSVETIWNGAKDTFLPYEGAVSTLHMLDIPTQHRLDITNSYLNAVNISGISRTGIDESKEWKKFSLDAQTEFEKGDTKFNWVFEGALDGDRSLRLFLDYYNEDSFDIELVFWADEFFPNPENEKECLVSFKDLISLTHSFREICPSSEFAFNAYPVADTRKHRGEPATFFW